MLSRHVEQFAAWQTEERIGGGCFCHMSTVMSWFEAGRVKMLGEGAHDGQEALRRRC